MTGSGSEPRPSPDVPTLRGTVQPPAGDREEPPATLFLLGVPFHDVTPEEVLAWIASRARSGRWGQIVTCNLDFIMQAWRDPEMHRIHLDADLVIADGWPPVVFSRLFGPRLRARVAGSDLVQRLGGFARDHGLSVYALGGSQGVAAEAMRILQTRTPGLQVAGWSSPPVANLLDMDHDGLRDTISRAKPDVLLVALGAPKQDKWIRMNNHRIGVPVAIGVGGSLDFVAGVQSRAPRWIQNIGLEWLWRLARQPRRLFKRYSSNLVFLTFLLGRLAFARLLPGGTGPRFAAPDASTLGSRGAVVVSLPGLRSADEAAVFCRLHEPTAEGKFLVLDLSGLSWLNSLELGAIARLARAAWRGKRRLFLSGVCARLSRLIRLMRLDRCLELPDSPDDWIRRLSQLAAAPEIRETQWIREGTDLRIVLPEEFEQEEAGRAGLKYHEIAAQSETKKVIVDGGRLRYIDSSGLRFLKTVWGAVGERAGHVMCLRSFGADVLDLLRREGLGPIPTEGPGLEGDVLKE